MLHIFLEGQIDEKYLYVVLLRFQCRGGCSSFDTKGNKKNYKHTNYEKYMNSYGEGLVRGDGAGEEYLSPNG